MTSFRPYQQQEFDAIVIELQNNNKCIVKMFCGSGKSLIMHNIVKHFDLQLSVFVFPSLSLVDQFYTDYLKKSSSILKISSKAESTTEIDVITKFINNKKNTKKIICITYQSFNLLRNNLQGNKIDVCCYDEAHHAVGNTYQKLIFNDHDTISKQIFFTATPKNANGIVM
jgi:superfamily II DNA or RNA helicase